MRPQPFSGRGWQESAETLRAFAGSADKLKSVAAGVGGLYSDAEIDQLHRYSEEWNRLKATFENVAIGMGGMLEEGLATTLPIMLGTMPDVEGSMRSFYGAAAATGLGQKQNSSLADLMSQGGGHGQGRKSWGEQMDDSSAEWWQKFNAGLGDAEEKFPAVIRLFTDLQAAALADEKAGYKASAAMDAYNEKLETMLELGGKVPTMPGGKVGPLFPLPLSPFVDDQAIQSLYGNIGGGLNQPANSAASGYLSSMFQGGDSPGKESPFNNKKLQKQVSELGTQVADSFIKMAVGGESFSRVLTSLTQAFAEFFIKAVLFRELVSLATAPALRLAISLGISPAARPLAAR